MKSLDSLFTYGTLQLGGKSDHYLTKLNGTWKKAYVFGNFVTKSKIAKMGYPVLKLNQQGKKISGMLFQSKHLMRVIKAIDEYEGCYYRRVITKVYLSNGAAKEAFIYELAE